MSADERGRATGRMSARTARLRERLRRGLTLDHLELTDESAAHAGHPGAAGGAGHYRLLIVSPRFRDRDAVGRHRLVYEAVGDLIPSEVHALAIEAYTPEEWQARSG